MVEISYLQLGNQFVPSIAISVRPADCTICAGTLLQARLELNHPDLTPFNTDTMFNPPHSLSDLPDFLIRVAEETLSSRPTIDEFPAGKGKVLCEDTAAGDPASLGIACLLYGMAEEGDVEEGKRDRLEVKGVSMLEAVKLETEFLERDACRVSFSRNVTRAVPLMVSPPRHHLKDRGWSHLAPSRTPLIMGRLRLHGSSLLRESSKSQSDITHFTVVIIRHSSD
jgi:hypothetical protein